MSRFTITFDAGTVTNCDFIGRTVSGVCAVVSRDGVEVFRSTASVKRFLPRQQAEAFIARQEI